MKKRGMLYPVLVLVLVISMPFDGILGTVNAQLGVLPQPPTNLTAKAISSSEIDLSWKAPSDLTITGYKIERSTDSGTTWNTIVSNTGSTATTYSDTGLNPGTTYTYRVSTINLLGTSSPSNTISATTPSPPSATAPQPPTNLAANAASSSQINLSWTAPSNNGGSAITGYNVYRGTASGAEGSTPIATGIASTTYTDTGLTNGATYFYKVTAVNSAGESPQSNEASATPAAPSSNGIVIGSTQSTSGTVSVPPYQITLSNFNAGSGTNQLLVVGISANGNPASSVTFGGAQLTQAASSFFNNDAELWYLKNPAGTGNIVVTMSGATSAVVGAYALSGVDLANPIPTVSANHNTAASSPTISITTKNPDSLILDLPSIWGGVTLSSPTCMQQWDVNVQGAITGASSSIVVPSAGPATCKWTASSADSWDDVAVEIKASGTGAAATAPGSPTGLTAASGNAQVSLSWTAPSNNGGSAITNYKIYRSTTSGTETLLTTVGNVNSYTDTGLTNGATYFYKVTAVNSAGESPQSNEASATPAIATHSVVQVSSGLVVADPLNNETKTKQQLQSNPRYWFYNGDAVGENASYALFKNFTGLYIGAQAAPNPATKSGPPMNGEWAGFYAESPNTNDMLFHSIVSTPVRSIPTKDTWYENGIYVQTAQPFINYVTCTSLTGWYAPGLTWGIGGAKGNANQALSFQTYYENYSQNQPLTVDCTIITNGTNFLKAYINGVMVYENKTLTLGMPPPFNSYLEPQSDYAGQLLNGTFTDYYVTTNENVTVNSLPSNAVRVDMTDGSGKVLASAPVSSGAAILDVGRYHFPLSATIQVYDSTNTPIASTPSPAKIYGGDVYAFR